MSKGLKPKEPMCGDTGPCGGYVELRPAGWWCTRCKRWWQKFAVPQPQLQHSPKAGWSR